MSLNKKRNKLQKKSINGKTIFQKSNRIKPKIKYFKNNLSILQIIHLKVLGMLNIRNRLKENLLKIKKIKEIKH